MFEFPFDLVRLEKVSMTKWFFVFWFICIQPILVCFGSEPLSKEEQTFRFAKSLYTQQEYFRSITEFKRFSFLYPKSPLMPEAKLWIAKNYLAGKQPEQAVQYLKTQTQHLPKYAPYWAYLGLSYLDWDSQSPFSLRQEHVNQAVQSFQHVPANSIQGKYIYDFVDQWKKRPPIKRYSPILAGSLSALLPGTGSAYTGRWREGSYAFLMTTLFLAAAYQTRQAGKFGLSALFGGFGLIFYGSNIYTAVNSAYKRNDQQESIQLNRLRQKHGIFFQPHQTNGRF